MERWYNPSWWDEKIPQNPIDYKLLRDTLDKGNQRNFSSFLIFFQAVVKCMMTDVPYGVLLSGGLDSSLISSIASRHVLFPFLFIIKSSLKATMRVEDNEKTSAWYPNISK